MIVKSLGPVIDDRSWCLILAAAPDETSVSKQQYYADRYNVFWDVIATASGFELPLTYKERIAYLKAKRIALWYVAAECEREGDIDSSIRNEKPNDFAWLYSAYPGLKSLLFNGAKAERLYKKHFGAPSGKHRLPFDFKWGWATMPSTNATPVRPMRYVRPCADRLGRGSRYVDSFVFGRVAEYDKATEETSDTGAG
jgi:hypoxanthine-DNA glycosylase